MINTILKRVTRVQSFNGLGSMMASSDSNHRPPDGGDDPWSKFRFWLGVTVVGFLVMAMSPEGTVADLAGLGCCFGVISATIAAIAASQSMNTGAKDISMMPLIGASGHQTMTPGNLISKLTEKSTSQGMTNAAALRHHAGVSADTPIDVTVLQTGLERMGVARLDEASAQAILTHLDVNKDQILQESEVAPNQSHQSSDQSQPGAVTAESMISNLTNMASSEEKSLDEFLRAHSSASQSDSVEPVHLQEVLSQLGIATIDEASADVLLAEMSPMLESIELSSNNPVASKVLVEKHLNDILDKTAEMNENPAQILEEATPRLVALTENLDPETKNRVLSAWNESVSEATENPSSMDSEKRAAIVKGVAGAAAGLTLTGAAAAGAATLKSSLSSASKAAPDVTSPAFGDAERIIEEFREEAALIADEGGDLRNIENTLRTTMRAKTADLPFGVRQKVQRELDGVIHSTAKQAKSAASKGSGEIDQMAKVAAEKLSDFEEVTAEKIQLITEEVTDQIESKEVITDQDQTLPGLDERPDILSLHERISGLTMHSERQKIVAEFKDPLLVEMIVDQTERSFSVSSNHLRGGQTIRGHLPSSPEAQIQIRIPPGVEVPKVGETYQIKALLKEWSAMRRSLIFDSLE